MCRAYTYISVLRIAFFLDISHPPHPHNANNIERFFLGKLPPSHAHSATALHNTWMTH